MSAWYTTREAVQTALDIAANTRTDAQIDRNIAAASESVRRDMRRQFHPVQATRYLEWPPRSGGNPSHVLRLEYNEVISVTTVTADGTAVTGYTLEPNDTGPPYARIEMPADGAGFTYGDTPQRNIAVTGLFGYRDDRATIGTLSTELLSTATTHSAGTGLFFAAGVGVGSTLVIGTERITVTAKANGSGTGITTTGALTSNTANVTVPVSSATGLVAGLRIQIDSEQMLILAISGTNLTVKRATNGTVLAAHNTSTTLFTPRLLTLTRGAHGTTAATHATSTAVTRWVPPPPIEALTIAQAIDLFENERAGWARTVGTGDTQRDARGASIAGLRDHTWRTHGRRNRIRAV